MRRHKDGPDAGVCCREPSKWAVALSLKTPLQKAKARPKKKHTQVWVKTMGFSAKESERDVSDGTTLGTLCPTIMSPKTACILCKEGTLKPEDTLKLEN